MSHCCRPRLRFLFLLSLCSLVAVGLQAAEGAAAPNGASDPTLTEDGQWTMAAKTYSATRYSGLDQIRTDNVKDLKVQWTFSTGLNRGHECAPLVIGSTMYVVSPFPNIVYALDLTKSGAVKWKYEPPNEPAAQGVACCDHVNRGAAYADGRIFFNTLDGHTIALNAETGVVLWNTKLGDINLGETITMAPLVVKGKVLVGNSGGEYGVRGWLTALDVATGKQVWRVYSTGPDADVLIGPDFKPFYPQNRGKDLGVSTWPPGHWQIGGSTGLGLDFVRPRSGFDLLRHRQSRHLESRTTAWRKPLERGDFRPQPGHGSGAVVLSIQPSRPL